MNKIAKSIKRLRTANDLSQEELAEKLFVSRQAVSSWENNRTQPDIEMIENLAEIFDVSIEELIYGEKRKVEIDNEDAPRLNKNLIIVFSVLGSIFIALSLVFFLFIGWENFGIITKSIFSFFPILIGQGFAAFSYFKKREKTAWRESASILWSIGVIATFALINGIFDINISATIFLLATCLTILPAIYIMDAVSPLIPYYILSLSFDSVLSSYYGDYEYTSCIFSTIFVGLGILYTILAYKKDKSARIQFGLIASTVAVGGLLFVYNVNLDNCIFYSTSWYALFTAYFTGLIAYGKENTQSFHVIGSLGLMISMLLLTFTITPGYGEDSIFDMSHGVKSILTLIFKWLLCAGMILAGFMLNGKDFKQNKVKLLKCITGIAITALTFIFYDDVPVAAIVIAMIASVLFMISGTKENNFLDFNIGLIALLVCLVRIIIIFSEDILLLAIIMLIAGIALLTTNLALLKKAKKEKATPQINGGELDV